MSYCISQKHKQVQVKSALGSNFFCNSAETKPLNGMNWMEKRQRMRDLGARMLRGYGECALNVFNYLLDRANNNTGISFHSQERMADVLGFSKRSIVRAIKLLGQKGLIKIKRRGRKVTNEYKIHFALLKGSPIEPKKEKTPKSYPRKQDKTYSSFEVTSDVTLTTNTEDKEVTNSNTKVVSQNSFVSFVSFDKPPYKTKDPNEVIDPDEWYPAKRELEFVKGYVGSFLAADSYIDEYKQEMAFKHPNGIKRREMNYGFYIFVKTTYKLKQQYGSRYIPLHARRAYRERSYCKQEPLSAITVPKPEVIASNVDKYHIGIKEPLIADRYTGDDPELESRFEEMMKRMCGNDGGRNVRRL